jgi:signal peptidase I
VVGALRDSTDLDRPSGIPLRLVRVNPDADRARLAACSANSQCAAHGARQIEVCMPGLHAGSAAGRPLVGGRSLRVSSPRRRWPGFVLGVFQRAALAVTAVVALAVLPAIGAAFLGYDSFVVVGGSMEPAVREGGLVIAKRVDPATVAAGDIITYRHPDRPSVPVTHRVVQVFDDQGGRYFQTRGDANLTPDPELVSGSQPVSRLMLTIPYAGIILSALRTIPGQLALVALPALLLATRALRRQHPEPASMPWTPASPIATPLPPGDQAGDKTARAVPFESNSRAGDAKWSSAMQFNSPVPVRSRLSIPLPGLGRLAHWRFRSFLWPRPERPSAAAWMFQQHSGAGRLDRLSGFIDSHGNLTRDLGGQAGEGVQPLVELMARHAANAWQLERNVDRQLQPVREYADALEANLNRLLAKLQSDGGASNMALVAQFEADRARAEQVRATIEELKAPLRAAVEREAAAIDMLLAGFDPDMTRLEESLAEQRRDLLRIVSGLRSEQMGEALGFLRDRAAELEGLAAAGIAEIDEIDAALRVSAGRAREQSARSTPLVRVLDALEGTTGAEGGATTGSTRAA